MTFIPHLTSYTVLHQIGKGGMAKVYLAEHKKLGHEVAIKVLSKEFTYNKNIRSRFIDEAKKMVRMNHPNVVKVSDLIDEEDTVAIVMEFVDGKTLSEICATHKLTDNDIEMYLRQMLKALEYIHTQGLIHRDIKPSNFILGKDGNLKLTDFGISKSFTNNTEHTQTSTSMSLGTPMYMSPEQVRSTKDVTYLTDIYSLGVVLWQLASGIKPYDSDTTSVFDLQLKIVQENLPLTGTKWDVLIQKATQKEEGKRFESISNFVASIVAMTSPKEFLKIEESVKDFEKTIVSEKPDKKKNEKENRSGKTFFEKVKQKKYLLLGCGLLIAILIIIFQCNKEAGPPVNQTYQDAKGKAKEEVERLKKTEEIKQAKAEEDRLKKAEEFKQAKAEEDRLKKAEEIKQAKEKEDRLKKVEEKKAEEEKTPSIKSTRLFGDHLEAMMEDFLGEMNWRDAKKTCKELGDGWRLPAIDELQILHAFGHWGGDNGSSHWSSSRALSDGEYYPMIFNFSQGHADHRDELLLYSVGCVRTR